MDADIEKLLSDDTEEENKDLKKEEQSAAQEESPAEKTDETDLAKANKTLKRELRKRQEELATLKAKKEEPVKEAEAKELKIDENDPGVKLWDKRIEEKALEKVKPILEANRNRAIRQFIERRPEYASGENKAKLKECVEAASGKVEEGEILEAMLRTWASQNYQELEKAAARRDQSRTQAQRSAIKASSVGEGVRNEDDFTEAESSKAESLGMTVEEYRKARAGYRANSVNFTT